MIPLSPPCGGRCHGVTEGGSAHSDQIGQEVGNPPLPAASPPQGDLCKTHKSPLPPLRGEMSRSDRGGVGRLRPDERRERETPSGFGISPARRPLKRSRLEIFTVPAPERGPVPLREATTSRSLSTRYAPHLCRSACGERGQVPARGRGRRTGSAGVFQRSPQGERKGVTHRSPEGEGTEELALARDL